MSQHNDIRTIINDIVTDAQYADHCDLAESDDAQDIVASQTGVCLWRGTATVRGEEVPAAIYAEEGEDKWVVWSVRDDGDGYGPYLVKAYHGAKTAEMGALLAPILEEAEGLEDDEDALAALVGEGTVADHMAWDLVGCCDIDADDLLWAGTQGCAGWDIYEDGIVVGAIHRTRDGRVKVSAYGYDHARAIEVTI